jgi:hypothetical protein
VLSRDLAIADNGRARCRRLHGPGGELNARALQRNATRPVPSVGRDQLVALDALSALSASA